MRHAPIQETGSIGKKDDQGHTDMRSAKFFEYGILEKLFGALILWFNFSTHGSILNC
jgi:hypothetical protein